MNEKSYIYLVMGDDGDDEFSHYEWITATYSNKKEATDHATKANEEQRRLVKNETPYPYSSNNSWNKYDLTEWYPSHESRYSVKRLVLIDSVAQFLNTVRE